MQISRHWRMNANRYRMEGSQNLIDLEVKIDGILWIITYKILSLQTLKKPHEYSNKIEVSRRLKQGNDKLEEQRAQTAA